MMLYRRIIASVSEERTHLSSKFYMHIFDKRVDFFLIELSFVSICDLRWSSRHRSINFLVSTAQSFLEITIIDVPLAHPFVYTGDGAISPLRQARRRWFTCHSSAGHRRVRSSLLIFVLACQALTLLLLLDLGLYALFKRFLWHCCTELGCAAGGRVQHRSHS